MHDVPVDIIPMFILGSTVLAFVYHVVLYQTLRDRFLIHYLAYLFFASVFMLSKSGLPRYFMGIEANNLLMHCGKEAIQIVYLTSYFNFIVRAIGIERQSRPFLFRYWTVTMWILVSYAAIYTLLKVLDYNLSFAPAFITVRIFIFLITGVMLFQSYKLRSIRFQRIILLGSTLYFIFGLISFITNFNTEEYNSMLVQPIEWMMLGTFADIIIFSYAIGYRNRKEWEKLNKTLLHEANKLIGLQKEILEKQTELENERSRIAADMHDDLGSGLTKITYLTQMAMRSDDSDNIKKINKTASELVGNMSELIWVMKEENNTLEDLASYIRSYAADYLDNNSIKLSMKVPESFENIIITGTNRRNIFLTVKECLHNVVKHADASQVIIEISITDELCITVRDDGKGIDSVQKSRQPGGHGFLNMKRRTAHMNGSISIESNNGTVICLKIPLTNSTEKSTVCTIAEPQ